MILKTVIVYDSYFGNTEKIALAIRDSLRNKVEDVEAYKVDSIKPEQLIGVQLLIVGSPTRAFRPTKAITGFLNGISPGSLTGVRIAAFDTRISALDTNSRLLNVMVKIFGYAAEPIAEKLVKKGGTQIISPEGFYVKESEGPLKDGELERAAEWAKPGVKKYK